ncbi:hypothetical protein Leryth_026757 [Lithospermum erythrorhizon]|nr:hypothetical protein Leryth_026757 [Lithospermum erythrorhizon]
MSDISNLEKLGTELKCPICLSLLNGSISLTCNHVFCNACIDKSMKSASGCPVCKVPFHRREIRPAPHMDNLVAIYKNMEVASGVNMFISQTGPRTQEASNEDVIENNKRNTGPEKNLDSCTTLATSILKKCNRKGSNKSSDEGRPNSSKPSFPTKKRVQVPQHSAPETPALCAKSKGATCDTSNMKNGKKATICENGEPVLSPFFWMREDDEQENSSQHTDGDHSISTPQDAPNFSDIMESDDDLHSKGTPNKKNCMASNILDLYDSELFEWTQRPCSPELCSSMELQDGDTDKDHKLEENREAGFEDKCQNKEKENNGTEEQRNSFPSSSGPVNRIYTTKDGTNKLRKRVQKVTKNIQKKRVNRSLNQTSGTLEEPPNLTNLKMENLGTNINATNLKDNSQMQRTISARAKGRQLGKGTAVCAVVGPTSCNASKSFDLSTSFSYKRREKGICSSKTGEEGKSISPLQQGLLSDRKSKKLKHCTDDIICSPNEPGILHPLQKSKLLRSVKFAEDHGSRSIAANGSRNIYDGEKHETEKSATNIEFITSSNSSKPDYESNVETISNGIQCAFCQSTEESEVSGVMVHFFKGKPVDENFNGGSGVIHAHKSCTEWAPNIYFQDDNVLNLESELARSKRLKCGLCGIKGAALGCYSRSCHRSFHVACAKLTPQCRWDHENFVMLCPLHATSKLPTEEKKRATKRCHQIERSKAKSNGEPSVIMTWNSHEKSKDMVLCCSALSDIEKGIITEFGKVAGVKIVKNWDSSVTHVIASTDENGACRRTLKFLMGILGGKWILTIEYLFYILRS